MEEIRAKNPKLAARADAGSRKAAIRMFCIECMGGSRHDAASCSTSHCALWSKRGGGWMGHAGTLNGDARTTGQRGAGGRFGK